MERLTGLGKLRHWKLRFGRSEAADVPLLCNIHIPKTAGTSFSALLHANYPDARMRLFTINGRKDCKGEAKTFASTDEDILLVKKSITNQDLQAISGHFPYGIHNHTETRAIRYVSFMREPISRAISQYFHVMDATRNSALRKILVCYDFDFRKAIDDGAAIQFSNDQTRMLIGSNKLNLTNNDLDEAKYIIERDYLLVGTQETFSKSVTFLAAHLNWSTLSIPKLNQGKKTCSAPSEPLIRLWREVNALDLKLYEWVAREYLPQRLANIGS